MTNLTDIYYIMDSYIIQNGFNRINLEGKKQLLENSLKKYISNKIATIDKTKIIRGEDLEKVSVNDLVDILGELIPEEEHADTLSHLTHYVLGVAGTMQGYSITWWSEEEPSFIECPLIEFTEKGEWDTLKTHRNTSYVKTFSLAYDVFKNTFMSKTKDNKQLVLTTAQLPKDDK